MAVLRLHKCSRIEPALPGALIARQISFLSRNPVGTGIETRARGLHIQGDRRRENALRRHDGEELPAIQHIPARAVKAVDKRELANTLLHHPLRHVSSSFSSLPPQPVTASIHTH